MRRFSNIILLALIMFSIGTYVHATPIRYDVVNSRDDYGNSLGGYVEINSDPIINPTEGSPESPNITYCIIYDITQFDFQSIAGETCYKDGDVSNDWSHIQIHLAWPDYITTFPNGSGSSTVFSGTNGVYWYNDANGVCFVGSEDTLLGYSTLPDIIHITFDRGYAENGMWGPSDGYGPTDGLVLQKSAAPVPEPTSMLLLGIGLIGLAGFRKKFKK